MTPVTRRTRSLSVLPLVVNYMAYPEESRYQQISGSEGCERGLVQIYSNCWICVCISSSHPTRLVCSVVQPPWLALSFSGPWCLSQPTTPHQQPTNNKQELCRPHPTMLARDTAAAHYHPLPIIPAQYPTAVRSASPHSTHTHTRKGGGNRRQMRGTATSLCQQTITTC